MRVRRVLPLLTVAGLACWLSRPAPVRPDPLTQDAYVWQRVWTPAVTAAVAAERGTFRRFVVLAADVSAHGTTTVHPGPLPAGSGVAVRVGPASADALRACAVVRLAVAGRDVAEVQLDYDCPTSRLAGYAALVRAVRAAAAPVPVVVTALPTWLSQPAFADVARAAGGFVLQVHSLHAPAGPDGTMALCDAAEAERAVALADRLGVPFRVALPTYSYAAGFAPDGRLLGLAAEGPPPAWPAGTVVRVMRSDPVAIAALVRRWTAAPPSNLTGLIWYRLPVPGDAMNWRPATLHAVMAGRTPAPHLRVDLARPSAGLTDVWLANDGDADAHLAGVRVTVAGDVIVAEAVGDFDRVDSPQGSVTFHPTVDHPLAPGDRAAVGWVRLSTDTEVRADVEP